MFFVFAILCKNSDFFQKRNRRNLCFWLDSSINRYKYLPSQKRHGPPAASACFFVPAVQCIFRSVNPVQIRILSEIEARERLIRKQA